MSTESLLQAKYDAVVRDWEAAKEASEAAKKEMYEKRELADQQPEGSKKKHLAWAEYFKADIIWIEKYEQECAAECEKCEITVYLMVHRHGVDSKAVQIAKQRLELARMMSVQVSDVEYLMKWCKMRSKGWQLYYQLKAAGCDAAADDKFWRAIDDFENRIKNESNGKAFNEAWIAAEAALNKWEKDDDRTDWNAAKLKYDAELEKWNAFKPKGDEYAKMLEVKINEYINKVLPIAFILNEHVQVQIQRLEDNIEQKNQDINDLKKNPEQQSKEIKGLKEELKQNVKDMCELKETLGKMAECIKSLTQGMQTLMRVQCQYIAESEATARTAVEREWQVWFEHTMAERRTLEESEIVASNHQHEQFYIFDE